MNNIIFFIMLIILIISLICVYDSEANSAFHNNSPHQETKLYEIESRRKKTGHYFLYPYHGWYALSWIYWIKVKLIIIAFFVGTAFIWAIQYISKFYRHCPSVDHIHYGHYRSLDDPVLVKFLHNLQ